MRTVFPEETFLSANPDYDYPHNTSGNFTPPYTGEYYMRAVGGGGSASLRTDTNECVGGGAGGGYEGRIFLIANVAIPYSVGTGGTAVTMGNWGNNGTDTILGNIVLGGGYAGNTTKNGGRGGNAGICKGGLAYYHLVSNYFIGNYRENPESDGVLFGGGAGMTFFHNDDNSHFDFLANGCGKHVRTKAQIITYNDAPHYIRFGGCSIFGLSQTYVAAYGGAAYGTGGEVYRTGTVAANAMGGRIQIWRLQ